MTLLVYFQLIVLQGTYLFHKVLTTQTTYNIDVSVSDGENSIYQTITIIVDNNNAPVINSMSFTAEENKLNSWNNKRNGFRFNLSPIVSGGDDSFVYNDSSSGLLTFDEAPDFESDPISYTIEVSVSDGTNSQKQDISIILSDANDSPEFISSTSFSVS